MDREELKAKIKELYLSGLTVQTVAEKLVYSKPAIEYWIKKMQIHRGRVRVPRPDGDELLEEYNGGLSTYQLGKKYGVSAETIRRDLIKTGKTGLGG